jgi:hypothetical protein
MKTPIKLVIIGAIIGMAMLASCYLIVLIFLNKLLGYPMASLGAVGDSFGIIQSFFTSLAFLGTMWSISLH